MALDQHRATQMAMLPRTTIALSKWELLSGLSALLLAVWLAFIAIKPIKVLPVIAPAPVYSLIDQTGERVTSEDLKGQVVLYDFIYTHCTTICPVMTGQMLQVQKRLSEENLLGRKVTLVTITFDPERDTPERLSSYASQMHALPTGWLWLTGELFDIKRVVGSEFGVYFERVPPGSGAAGLADTNKEISAAEEGYDFIHASVFVLVDSQGMIRAEYRELIETDRVLADIARVMQEDSALLPLSLLYQLAHKVRAYP